MLGHYPVPEGLAWDLFLGPAPQVEYSPVCHPFNRRGWADWGAGPLGDMSAHLIDHADWALDLGLPTTVETVSMSFNGVCFPHATTTYYEFAARGRQPAVKMTWYDGGLLPPKPVTLTEVMLLGIESLRGGKKLVYDGANMRVTNDAGANEFLTRVPRDGWTSR